MVVQVVQLAGYSSELQYAFRLLVPPVPDMHICIAIWATEPGVNHKLVFVPVELMMTLVILGSLESFFYCNFFVIVS